MNRCSNFKEMKISAILKYHTFPTSLENKKNNYLPELMAQHENREL